MVFKNYWIVGVMLVIAFGPLSAAERDLVKEFARHRITDETLDADKLCQLGDLLAMKECCNKLITAAKEETDIEKKEKYIHEAYGWFFRLGLRIGQDKACLFSRSHI